MKKIEHQQANHTSAQLATREACGPSHASPRGAILSASPAMAAQRGMADLIQQSSRLHTQRKAIDSIYNSPLIAAQRRSYGPAQLEQQTPATPNRTGLPDHLKAGIEALSGLSMDSVKVHYNSSAPSQLNALAYAQGNHIHVAPGQEKHLPHEAWHVVQQAQGRVRPTTRTANGAAVNDDTRLEREADIMGGKAVQRKKHQAEHSGLASGLHVAGPLSTLSVQLAACDCHRPVPGPLQAAVNHEKATVDAGFPHNVLLAGQRLTPLTELRDSLHRSIAARQAVQAVHKSSCAGRPSHAHRISVEQGYLLDVIADLATIHHHHGTAWVQQPDTTWTRTLARFDRDPVVTQTRTDAEHQDALDGWAVA